VFGALPAAVPRRACARAWAAAALNPSRRAGQVPLKPRSLRVFAADKTYTTVAAQACPLLAPFPRTNRTRLPPAPPPVLIGHARPALRPAPAPLWGRPLKRCSTPSRSPHRSPPTASSGVLSVTPSLRCGAAPGFLGPGRRDGDGPPTARGPRARPAARKARDSVEAKLVIWRTCHVQHRYRTLSDPIPLCNTAIEFYSRTRSDPLRGGPARPRRARRDAAIALRAAGGFVRAAAASARHGGRVRHA
jgi:hypothetical protein